MEIPRYCSNCGAPLSMTANFCASCGKQLPKSDGSEVPSEQTNAASASSPETVHLIMPGAARHSGFLGIKVESFVIVYTNLRIVFALQTTEMMQENIKRAKLDAQQEGKGFFGKWGAQLNANSGKQYWQMAPQQILAEHPCNFAINREHLRSIRMREDHGDENSVSSYTIEFDTTAGKHKFRLGSLNIRDLKKIFQQIYGNIVR